MRVEDCKFCKSTLRSNGELVLGVTLDQERIHKIKSILEEHKDVIDQADFVCDVIVTTKSGNFVVDQAIINRSGGVYLSLITRNIVIGDEFSIGYLDNYFCYSDIIEDSKY